MEPGIWRLLLFALRGLLEGLLSFISYPFLCVQAENVQITYIESERNLTIVSKMDSYNTWRRFKPSAWACTSSSQTVFGNMNVNNVYKFSRSEELVMSDGVSIVLDWKEHTYMAPDCPIVVCLYGIAGSCDSKMSRVATDMCMKNGWRSVVYNRRGHGKSSLLPRNGNIQHVTKIFPQHADMDDMKQVVDYICETFPNAPMILLGFSVGSNAVVRYLGEFSKPFIAGISVCNGVDLIRLTTGFDKTANALMISQMRSLVKDRLPEIVKLQEAHGIKFDWQTIMSTLDSRTFETLLMLPIYKFPDLDSYLLKNSCKPVLNSVSCPLLCMTALDDPLIHPDIPALVTHASTQNPNIFSLVTKRGGHLGWVSGWKGDLWGMSVIEQFIITLLSVNTHT